MMIKIYSIQINACVFTALLENLHVSPLLIGHTHTNHRPSYSSCAPLLHDILNSKYSAYQCQIFS